MTSVIFNDPSGSDYLYKFSGVQLNAPSGETLALGANAKTADNSNSIVTVGESYIRIPQGISNERPDISNSYIGMMRYLTTENLLEYFNGQTNTWIPISLPSPTLTSITPNYISFSDPQTNTNTYTLTGSNFNIAPGGISIEVIGNNGAGTILLPDSNSASSETSATFTFDPSGTEQLIGISNELPFAVKLTNTNSGFSSTLNNAIIATNAGPEFTQPSVFTPSSFQTFAVQDPCANFIVGGIDLSSPPHPPLDFTFVSGTAGGFNTGGVNDISSISDFSSIVQVPSGNRLSATATTYNFKMRVTDASLASSDANYTLTLANPTITSIDPSYISINDVVDINITGNYFIRDSDISFNKGSNTLTQTEVSYNSITSLTIKDVSAGEIGVYDISLANGSVIVNVPSVVLNITPEFIDATGGDVVGTYIDGGITYKYHIFKTTGSSSFIVNSVDSGGPSIYKDVDYLIVGAGGGSKGSPDCCVGAGGGGAGGVLQGTYTSLSTTTYTTNVGAGVSASNGNSSAIFSLTAYGGGKGANYQVPGSGQLPGGGGSNADGATVGSGGGAAFTGNLGSGVTYPGGTGTSGQGNNGGSENPSDPYVDRYGGGGGGAGGNGFNDNDGSTPGNGGIGTTTTIITTTIATSNAVGQVSGSDVYFGGGGGSSVRTNSYGSGPAIPGRPGGVGGGGTGKDNDNQPPTVFNGVANTGGGGGGGRGGNSRLGSLPDSSTGGSGVIILRYRVSV